jgi:hypothetical protein
MERFWQKMFSSSSGGGGAGPPIKLQEAIEREANKPEHRPAWYKVEAIYVKKTNPITDYRVILSEENPP